MRVGLIIAVTYHCKKDIEPKEINMRFLKISLMIAGLLATQAHASLMNADWTTQGDAKAAIDTRTGLEWLDLTVTDGMSIASVLSQTSAGGLFAGWRLPTMAEVLGLLKTATGQTLAVNQIVDIATLYGTLDNELSRAIGVNYTTGKTSSYTTYAWGMVMDAAGVIRYAGTSDIRYGSRKIYGGVALSSANVNSAGPEFGVFLVSDGGLTLTSVQNPELNINNPNSPINNPVVVPGEPSDVPVPVGVLFTVLSAGFLMFRSKVLK